jgi:hypothetical protein
LPGSFDAIKLGHADIENGDLRMKLGDELDGFPPVARLRDNLEIRLLIQQKTKAGPNNSVVVGEQDANGGHVKILA